MYRRHRCKGKPQISKRKSKQKLEFSKIIVIVTGLLFILALLDIRGAVRGKIDVSGYATQQILTTGGIFGASIVFYLNKSKIENLSKGKLRFLLLKLRLELKLRDKIPEENYQIILAEINNIDNMLDSKLDGSLEMAIQKDLEIPNY